jgi:hypothetical protein
MPHGPGGKLVRLELAALGVVLFVAAGLWLWLPSAQETSSTAAVGEAEAAARLARQGAGRAGPGAKSAGKSGLTSERDDDAAGSHDGEVDLAAWGLDTGGGRTTPPRDERATEVRAGAETTPRDELTAEGDAGGTLTRDERRRPVDWGRPNDQGAWPIDDTSTEALSDVPHSVRGAWGNVPGDPAASSRLFIELLVDPDISDAALGTLVRDTRETYIDATSLTVKVRAATSPGEKLGPLLVLSRRNYDTGEDFLDVRGSPVDP